MEEVDIQCYKSENSVMNALIPNHLTRNAILEGYTKKITTRIAKDIGKIQTKTCYFPNKCFGRNMFSVDRQTFSWSFEDILSTDENCSILLMAVDDVPDLILSVYYNDNETFKVVIQTVEWNNVHFTSVCKITIVDSSEIIQETIEEQHYFDSNTNWKIEFPCKLDNLDVEGPFRKSRIQCELLTSKGQIVSVIEENPSLNSVCNQYIKESIQPSNLNKHLVDLRASKQLCDVTLQSGDKSVQAHKVILCANSPVFLAMFQSDMREKDSNVVDIDDLDEETLDQMIDFMYSGCLDNLLFEKAMKLYKPADKYQILSLQHKCAVLILSNLTTVNYCAALCLAETHSDEQLRKSILKLILQLSN